MKQNSKKSLKRVLLVISFPMGVIAFFVVLILIYEHFSTRPEDMILEDTVEIKRYIDFQFFSQCKPLIKIKGDTVIVSVIHPLDSCDCYELESTKRTQTAFTRFPGYIFYRTGEFDYVSLIIVNTIDGFQYRSMVNRSEYDNFFDFDVSEAREGNRVDKIVSHRRKWDTLIKSKWTDSSIQSYFDTFVEQKHDYRQAFKIVDSLLQEGAEFQ